MKFKFNSKPNFATASIAFTLIEVCVAVTIVGIVFVSLYLALSGGFAIIQATREDLRATQILQEKMETIRLYTWEQINSNGFIPTNFTAPFYATNLASVSGDASYGTSVAGLTYTGRVTITNIVMNDASYSNDLRLVTITLGWRSSNRNHTRDISTYVSHYGLQSYIY